MTAPAKLAVSVAQKTVGDLRARFESYDGGTEKRSRIVRKAIALVDQIREEARAEEAAKLEAERARLDVMMADIRRSREELTAETGQLIQTGVDAGRKAERADAVAYLRERKGSWERAAAAIEGGRHLQKGAN